MDMNYQVLITGGTGSFGNALIDHLREFHPETSIIVFSRDENKQAKMAFERKEREKHADNKIKYVIGDIRDKDSLRREMKGVRVVFHAAALKHVPVGEVFPEETIKTNILGTKNVIDVANEMGVSKLINLSSDKAVNPINAYGMTKGLSEKLVAANRGPTVCISLRYGNVMGSRGSVIPIFAEQIVKEKPVPVTDLRMTRFMLPLKHAVLLTLICAEEQKNGTLYVIKSPACDLKTLLFSIRKIIFGSKTCSVENIGIRPGEKLHETLLTTEEVLKGQEIAYYDFVCFRVPSSLENWKYADKMSSEPFTSSNTYQLSMDETVDLLLETKILEEWKKWKKL